MDIWIQIYETIRQCGGNKEKWEINFLFLLISPILSLPLCYLLIVFSICHQSARYEMPLLLVSGPNQHTYCRLKYKSILILNICHRHQRQCMWRKILLCGRKSRLSTFSNIILFGGKYFFLVHGNIVQSLWRKTEPTFLSVENKMTKIMYVYSCHVPSSSLFGR